MCPRCKKNVVSVHVTEVEEFDGLGSPGNEVKEHHLCEACAQELNLPHTGLPQSMAKVLKLLQVHAKQAHIKVQASMPACPDCGMTLEELRRRGRVGCAKDYEVFREYLDELLERMHGARVHVGRLPGIAEGELRRVQQVSDLRNALELAVREEDYERAAELRDEIDGLETQGRES